MLKKVLAIYVLANFIFFTTLLGYYTLSGPHSGHTPRADDGNIDIYPSNENVVTKLDKSSSIKSSSVHQSSASNTGGGGKVNPKTETFIKSSSVHQSSASNAGGGGGKVNPKTFMKGTFCYDHLINTYSKNLPVCNPLKVTASDQVKCYGSKLTRHMAMCSFHNIALTPQGMKNAITNDVEWHKPQDRGINLLQGTESSCNSVSIDQVGKATDPDDFQVRIVKQLSEASRLPVSVCDIWINKTTIFHVSNALHIYFRFMDLYSVHKALFDYKLGQKDDHLVLRIGSLISGYRFPDFDRALFPGALTLKDFPDNVTICFKEAVLAPRSYQSVPFRCKMDSGVRSRCFACKGKGLSDSPFQTFRKRVLKACNISDSKISSAPSVVVVSRQAYERWVKDDPKKFQRVLQNEGEMVRKIQNTFPSVTVDLVHMEHLPICEQVKYAVKADIMLGVHGAGLVHFWWLRDKAHALELEPSSQVGNPSFRMLTTLAGRSYDKERIHGGRITRVSVNIDHVISYIRKHIVI